MVYDPDTMHRWFRIAVLSMGIGWAVTACGHTPAGDESAPQGRLTRTIRPVHYTIDLEVRPDANFFSGEVAIALAIDAPTDRIWLHAEDLEVSQAILEDIAREARAASWEDTDARGVVALRFSDPIGPGPATLRVRYRANVGQQLEGLYVVDVDGASYAFTQLAPISGRRVFPGFDEPSFKTPFDVSLTVPGGLEALANTPAVERRELPNGDQRIRFATTPPLRTYLVAWAVGPFDVSEGRLPPTDGRDHPVPFRGLATRGRGRDLTYALAHTPPLLESLESYFGTAYPFRKLDVIAVPDFEFGAMENVGAITFRESLLLIDPATAPE
jgi:alanyl aminopeptidase